MADYYAILGISHAAESDEIAKAYRRAALTYNPECNPNSEDPPELARRFKLVSQAYTVLANPKTRAVYDAYAESGVRHGGAFDPQGAVAVDEIDPAEVFRRFFGVDNPFQIIGDVSGLHSNQHHFYSEAAAAQAAAPAKAIPVTVEVALEDVFTGKTKSVSFEADGSKHEAQVQLPRGVVDGSVVVLETAGHTLQVTVAVSAHERFTRQGNDLTVTVPIKLVEALTGTTVKVQLIDDRVMDVLLDEIVHPDFSLSLGGEGLPDVATGRRGDLIVKCSTQFPKYLSAEQRQELRRIFD